MLETRTKQAKIWEHRHYLALDEISMISKDFLALLARNIAIEKESPEDRSFGGISVIMLGQSHVTDKKLAGSIAFSISIGSHLWRDLSVTHSIILLIFRTTV